jgi:hypothetical protein
MDYEEYSNPVKFSNAIVIMIEDRFFSGFGKNGRIQTAWSLAGAHLFGPWRIDEIEAIKRKLKAKGKQPLRFYVELQGVEL